MFMNILASTCNVVLTSNTGTDLYAALDQFNALKISSPVVTSLAEESAHYLVDNCFHSDYSLSS